MRNFAMKILDKRRFKRLIDGKLVDEIQGDSKRILFLKHDTWLDPDNQVPGEGGRDAVSRIIYSHYNFFSNKGYDIDFCYADDLTYEVAKEYDFVHCSFWHACFMFIRWGIPYILNMHDNAPLLEEKGTDFYEAYRYVIEQSLVTTAQTDQIAEQWDELSHKIVSIPVAIETDEILMDNSIEREEYVLCAGMVEDIKNHHLVAKACNELGVNLLVIGNPKSENAVTLLKKEVESSNGLIVWIDQSIPFKELVKYYQRCKVFALPTAMDIPGLVFLEALCCGANVVVSEQGDYKSKNPKIVRCDLNSDSVKEALLTAWNMPYDESGRQYVVDKHNPRNCLPIYEKKVYYGGWKKDYTILDKSTSLYELDFSDNGSLVFKMRYSHRDLKDNITYSYRVWVNGELTWDDTDYFPNTFTIGRYSTSASIPTMFEKVEYELLLDGVLVERGGCKYQDLELERTFEVEDFFFLQK